MSEVTFIVKGLAICNFKNNNLAAHFLDAGTHALKLSIGNGAPNPQVIALTGFKTIDISMTNHNAVDPTNTYNELTGNIVNLDHLHGLPDSHLPLRNPPLIDTIKLSIPGARCFTHEFTEFEHELWRKIYKDTSPPVECQFIEQKKITAEIGAKFTFNNNGNSSIDIIITDSLRKREIINLPDVNSVDYTITFDNTCEECGNDFFLYYSVLDGRPNNYGGRHIEIVEDLDHDQLLNNMVKRSVEELVNLQIACNPIEGCGEDVCN